MVWPPWLTCGEDGHTEATTLATLGAPRPSHWNDASLLLTPLLRSIGTLVLGNLLQDFIVDDSQNLEDRHWIWNRYGTAYRVTRWKAWHGWNDHCIQMNLNLSWFQIVIVLGFFASFGLQRTRAVCSSANIAKQGLFALSILKGGLDNTPRRVLSQRSQRSGKIFCCIVTL